MTSLDKTMIRGLLTIALITYTVLLGMWLTEPQKYISARDHFSLGLELESAKKEVEILRYRKQYFSDKVSEMEFAFSDMSVRFDDVLRAELTELEALSGARDLYGPGIVIIVQDGVRELQSGESANNVLVHDGDLISIVEELRNAGAEAISVNDERVLFGTSDIVCVGPVIMINGRHLAPPYVIKAIGDRKVLEATMNAPGSFIDLLRGWGIRVEVNTAMFLEICKHKEVQ